MSRLLRPEPGGLEQTVEPTWRGTEVEAPSSWLDRTGRTPRQWSVCSRFWTSGAPIRRRPVVLVHGVGIASSLVAPVAQLLGADGPTYAPDLPGFGRSQKPRPTLNVPEQGDLLAAWIRREIEAPAVIVGVSIGSQVALSAAVRHASSCAGVVLVSPTMDRTRRRWREQLVRWQIEQSTQSMGLRARQLRDGLRCGLPRAFSTVKAALEHTPEDDVAELTVPALVCRGSRDPLIREEWARQLAQRAGAQLASIPGAVHAMSYENPLELSRTINGFLDSLPTDPPG